MKNKSFKKVKSLALATMAGAFLVGSASVASANTGWQKQNGTYTYYENNGKVQKGRSYRQLPKANPGTSWYLTQDGKMLTGVQQWQGSYWFFNQDGTLHNKRDYVQSQWGDWYMVGDNGQVLSGVQQWMGSYYYFDPTTYLKANKQEYVKSQWGDWYMVGKDGRLMTGLVNWQGSKYYFDPSTYLKVTNTNVTVNGVTYHADQNGILSEVQNTGFTPSQINHTYDLADWQGSSQTAINDYIIMHDVGAESGAAANANYLRNNWESAYTQFVVGDGGQVFEVGEPGYVSWGALNANPYSPVQIELGRTYNRDQFIKDYTAYINVARYYAKQYGIPLTLDAGGAGTPGVKTHNWVTENIGGSHVDPYGYLASWGIGYNQFASDIANGVNQQQLNSVVYSQRQ